MINLDPICNEPIVNAMLERDLALLRQQLEKAGDNPALADAIRIRERQLAHQLTAARR